MSPPDPWPAGETVDHLAVEVVGLIQLTLDQSGIRQAEPGSLQPDRFWITPLYLADSLPEGGIVVESAVVLSPVEQGLRLQRKLGRQGLKCPEGFPLPSGVKFGNGPPQLKTGSLGGWDGRFQGGVQCLRGLPVAFSLEKLFGPRSLPAWRDLEKFWGIVGLQSSNGIQSLRAQGAQWKPVMQAEVAVDGWPDFPDELVSRRRVIECLGGLG